MKRFEETVWQKFGKTPTFDNRKAAVVYGLDLSLTRTGIAVIRFDGCLRAGLMPTPDSFKGVDRLRWFERKMSELIPAGNPVFLEGYAYGKGNQSHQAGELGGIVRLFLYRRRNPFFVVPPTRLKKFVAGKGNAAKDLMLKELFKRWKIDAADNNEADAIGLALMGAYYFRGTEGLPRTQIEALRDVAPEFMPRPARTRTRESQLVAG